MELKKTPNADLENKKLSFTLVGLVIVLALVYIVVEWTHRDVILRDGWEEIVVIEEEDMVPITMQEHVPPPPPPDIPPPPPVVDEIDIRPDDEDVADRVIRPNDDGANILPPPPPPPPVVSDEPDEHHVFIVVEKMPSFPGGPDAMTRFIRQNLRYPRVAEENGVEGRVTVSFVVNRDGEIVDIEIMRGVDRHLDAEAIRIVRAMPRWNPGEQRGKPVRVKFVLPIVFRL